MESNINYSNEYFNYLIVDCSIEEFEKDISPIFERYDSEWFLSKVENRLRDEISATKELLNNENDLELKATLELMNKKLLILLKMIEDKKLRDENQENLEQKPGDVKILFARNAFGNIMFDSSVDDISKYNDNKLSDLIELLKKLDCGETNFNIEKQRQLRNNKNLKGIFELKDFQIRLIYMREKDYTIVIGALVKKDDNSLHYKDTLLNMKMKSEQYRMMIRNGTIDIDKELEYSRSYFNQLISSVEMGK